MADSIRQQIVDALETRLKDILVAKGYKTDLARNIFIWRTTDLQESELPALVVRDMPEDVIVRGTNHEYTLTFELEAKIKNSPITAMIPAKEAREVIADVIKAIGVDPNFSNLVQGTRPVSNESLSIEQKDKKVASLIMKIEIRYVTKRFAPLTLA